MSLVLSEKVNNNTDTHLRSYMRKKYNKTFVLIPKFAHRKYISSRVHPFVPQTSAQRCPPTWQVSNASENSPVGAGKFPNSMEFIADTIIEQKKLRLCSGMDRSLTGSPVVHHPLGNHVSLRLVVENPHCST